MTSPSKSELIMHKCTICQEQGLDVVKNYPVLSFGDPREKTVLVVGINPSMAEYDGYLSKSKDPRVRHREQLDYFDNNPYKFFERLGRFFEGDAQKALGWIDNPWEKVGFTDMVKCPTRKGKDQWSGLGRTMRRKIIDNCRKYLAHQLYEISPSIIMTYGADVCRWFYPAYKQENDAYTRREFMINGKSRPLILVPQTQGSHTPGALIRFIQEEIAGIMRETQT